MFQDRLHAGRELAAGMADHRWVDPVVMGLPRGGVPVAFEVAAALVAPLDVVVARKVGAPDHPEFGIGAVGEGGVSVADRSTLQSLGLSDEQFGRLADTELAEVGRRVERYRRGRSLIDVTARDVIVVDDGLATGVTAEVAVRYLRDLGPRSITLAVPVCSPAARARLDELVDEVVCLAAPSRFQAVGLWYDRFDQTSDEEVIALLDAAGAPSRTEPSPARRESSSGTARIPGEETP